MLRKESILNNLVSQLSLLYIRKGRQSSSDVARVYEDILWKISCERSSEYRWQVIAAGYKFK